MTFSEFFPLDKRQRTLRLSLVIVKKKSKNYDHRID